MILVGRKTTNIKRYKNMFLPEGFDTFPGYKISDTGVILGRISGFDISFLLYGDETTFSLSDISHQRITPPVDEEEINVLSSQLGVDESVRKLIVEIAPKGIYGIAIVNEHRGVLAVIKSAMGGISGGSGVIRTVEYVYKFSPDNIKDEKQIRVLPLFVQTNFETNPQLVVTKAKEFNTLLLKEIKAINDKRFENLFASYEFLRERLEMVGSFLERINRDFYDQMRESRTEGVMFNEYPLIRLQNLLDGAGRVMDNSNLIKPKTM
jgi:hypothetical protein